MKALKDNHNSELENEGVVDDSVNDSGENLALTLAARGSCNDRIAAPSTMRLPAARVSSLAVVDENGFLVPIFTACDLLLELKTLWRATQV